VAGGFCLEDWFAQILTDRFTLLRVVVCVNHRKNVCCGLCKEQLELIPERGGTFTAGGMST